MKLKRIGAAVLAVFLILGVGWNSDEWITDIQMVD